MYGRGMNKEGGVGIGEEEERQRGLTLRRTAVVKNDVGSATVGKEGIGALMSPKAGTKMAHGKDSSCCIFQHLWL